MKLITERDLIREVAERFDKQYGSRPTEIRIFGDGGTFRNVIDRLYALDLETASVEDVEKIIGNDSWTSIKCDECGTRSEAVVQVGQEPDYESATANLCMDCLRMAARFLSKPK